MFAKLSHLHRPAVFAAAALLAACAAVGPDHQVPAVPVGAGWATPVDTTAPDSAALSQWWASLGDAQLTQLVERALAHNLNLRQAEANIESARASLARAQAQGQPTLAADGSALRQRISVNAPEYNPQRSPNQSVFDLGLSASWELDLFGSQRRQRESAGALLEASQADAIGQRLAVAAEVARTYATMRGAQRELAAREASVAALDQVLTLTEQRWRGGDAARAEVERAQARLDQARAALPPLRARRQAAALALGPLLGGLPETELALIESPASPLLLPQVPVGQRADVLRRRPDVLAAERRLAAATADIGVATAELFPKLTLSAGAGFRALTGSEVLNTDSRRGSVGPIVSWRLLDGGRVRAEIRASEARQRAAAIGYEQAVIAALSDAERALSQYQFGLQTLAAQEQAIGSSRRDAETTRRRYELGDLPLSDWLNAQRDLADLEAVREQLAGASASDLMLLYKALGGGWTAGATLAASCAGESVCR